MGYRDRESNSGGLSAECRGYELHDREGDKIGKVEEVFVDENDRPEYLGVKTGLLGNKLTLIPADLARADDERRLVEISESRNCIKDAPSLGTNEEITAEREREVRDHFGLESGASSASGGQGDSSPGYRNDSRGSGSREQGEHERGSGEGGATERREPWSDAGSGEPRDESAGHGGAAGSGDTGERRGARGKASDRETVRVSVWREKARAERIPGDDGSEEVRIRKEWVEEEEIVEVEGGRRGDGDPQDQPE